MTKRYVMINKNTGNVARVRGFTTRDAAREYKKNSGFKFRIFDTASQQVVR